MLVAVRQQSQEASALDGGGQLTLVDRAGAGQASGMILPFSAMKSRRVSTSL